MYSGKRQQTFRRNMSPQLSWSKRKTGKLPARSFLLHADFWLVLVFDREIGDGMFFRNVGWFTSDYRALFPKTQNSWTSHLKTVCHHGHPWGNFCCLRCFEVRSIAKCIGMAVCSRLIARGPLVGWGGWFRFWNQFSEDGGRDRARVKESNSKEIESVEGRRYIDSPEQHSDMAVLQPFPCTD
jgi:hypothetical protein